MRYIQFDHIFEVDDGTDLDEFLHQLILWVESRGWYTGGGAWECDEDGKRLKSRSKRRTRE